jgi:hypothetical protein
MHRAIRSCFDLGQMADNRAHRQRPVNMGEQRPAAGFLPDDGLTQIGQVHLGNDEAVLSRKMLVERPLQLILRRQMNIAIGQIDWRAVKDAVGFKLRPLRGGEYFEGGIRMAVFGHRPPMPKSRGGRKPRAYVVSPYFVMLNLFQHLTFSTSVSKTLKQVQGDGNCHPPKKTIFLHEPIWFIIASVF